MSDSGYKKYDDDQLLGNENHCLMNGFKLEISGFLRSEFQLTLRIAHGPIFDDHYMNYWNSG